ncbi:MAG: type II secretion system minor pseudopilin GspJ [Casimicrobiaceae bacterium]
MKTRGFTLVEVLIALTILALIGVLAYRAMAALADGEARLAVETSHWTTLDAFFARVESDLRAAVPRGVRHGNLREPALAATVDANGNAALTLTRASSDFDDDPGVAGQRIGYRLQHGTVEIAYWPALDNVDAAQPLSYPLLSGVTQLRIGYVTHDGRWIAQWPVLGEPAVPTAVRIELLLADGAHLERWITLQ